MKLIAAPGGTLGFAAPEQVLSVFGTISLAAGIYAIGGVAFYLRTGRIPHDRSSFFDTINDEDVHLPNFNVTHVESKFLAVAKLALRKAVDCRP